MPSAGSDHVRRVPIAAKPQMTGRRCEEEPTGPIRRKNAANRIPAIARIVFLGISVVAVLSIGVSSSAHAADTPASSNSREAVDFNRQIRPLLSSRCFACHGPDPDQRAAGLRLDLLAGASEDRGGYAAIVPGRPEESELILRIASTDDDLRMPPADHGEAFSAEEVELMRRWIRSGADYARHWSYTPVHRPDVPDGRRRNWASGPIDRFVDAKLEEFDRSPSNEAPRLVLARRVSLDLTGLPPSWPEARAFAHDNRPDAYRRYVDRLLASPAFGERWAQVWLDLARYADSAGYADDPERTIWAYRDYVIDSLNENKPFDQFTVEQLAGDLLDAPDESQLVATAFHRNTMTNNEGGTNDEEFRNEAVIDRTNTTFAVWMGTTMACAQCHTHKFDPITHEEYFQVAAFFNNTADADRKDESPVLKLYTERDRQQLKKLDRQIRNLRKTLADPASDRESIEKRLKKRQGERKAIQPVTTVPVLRELPADKRRATHVQVRGNYRSKAQEVQPATPAVFQPLTADGNPSRLDLAHWLVDDSNPLTARVIANRHWERLFGIGIVATSEEFGSQGELPSHPELLDYLASRIIEGGWDLKRLLREIVTSRTYRQDSGVTPAMAAWDGDNRWLARGPRTRITAEMVRDQALAVSGLLTRRLHGPPVKPPQPNLGLKAAFGAKTDWTTSSGGDRYRRGIYTMWRRSSPYPSMATFDAPNREVCLVRRDRTNTPLQALVTLNDPAYVEAAQRLARDWIAGNDSDASRIDAAFRTVLIRNPSQRETDRISELVDDLRQRYAVAKADARRMAEEPLGPLPGAADVVEHAVWTVVANVLLNLDEFFLKP